jgi:hypothetical protein
VFCGLVWWLFVGWFGVVWFMGVCWFVVVVFFLCLVGGFGVLLGLVV